MVNLSNTEAKNTLYQSSENLNYNMKNSKKMIEKPNERVGNEQRQENQMKRKKNIFWRKYLVG